VGDEAETEMAWDERIFLWLHLLFCESCRRLKKYFILLKETGALIDEKGSLLVSSLEGVSLSNEYREQLKSRIRQQEEK